MDTPDTIVYLNHVAYIGGAEVALLNTLTYLDRTRYRPIVLCPPGDLAQAIQALQIRHVAIPVLDGLNRYTLPRFLTALPRLARQIAREHPALMHANTNFTAEYAGLLALLLKIPTIAHIRDIEPLGRIGRWVMRHNTTLIAISNAVKEYLIQERIPASRIVRVYDGVDLRQYQSEPTPNPSQEGNGRSTIIGIVGQLGARKGHLYLLEAIRAIVQRHPAVRLWIVGQEPAQSTEHYTERLHQFVEQAGLQQHVIFWGFRTDIRDILAQLDILVLPSLQEPFGKIVIEAMAMGKPVVASRVGGVPEIVRDGVTGLLVASADAEALRRALEQLIEDRTVCENMGQAGRQRVERAFSLDKTVRATEQVYVQILGR